MTAATVVHNAQVRRRADGWLRWGWWCEPCQYGEWLGGKERAEAAAKEHNALPAVLAEVLDFVRNKMTCCCFDPRSGEYGDLCARCTLLHMLQCGAEA